MNIFNWNKTNPRICPKCKGERFVWKFHKYIPVDCSDFGTKEILEKYGVTIPENSRGRAVKAAVMVHPSPLMREELKAKGSILYDDDNGRSIAAIIVADETRELCDQCHGVGIVGVPALERLSENDRVFFILQDGSSGNIPAIDLVDLLKNRTNEEVDQLIFERLQVGKAIGSKRMEILGLQNREATVIS
jgi:hypothetical protein